MTVPAPFSSGFPLQNYPYTSRVQSQIDAVKNYYAVAFKPGFPLQASELNEMQELFYAQQTLTQGMFANWHSMDYLEQGGVAMNETPWDGCTPYSPSLITVSNPTTTTLTVTANSGWYLLKNPTFNGGLGVWVYNPTNSTILADYSIQSPITTDGSYGIIVKSVEVNCTTNAVEQGYEDRSLQDTSNINVINGPCGAARLKMVIVGWGKDGIQNTGEYFLPLVTAGRSTTTVFVKYQNNYTIATK